MSEDKKTFEQTLFIPKERTSKSLKKFFIISFVCIGLSFFSFKWAYYHKKDFFKKLNYKITAPAQKVSSKPSRTLPLLISLKEDEGPRLARVFVSISLNSTEKPIDKDFENLKSQLLFLLSGQSLAMLSDKSFQDQIQNQLNLFLSDLMIENLNIETKLLNQTRSSL